MTALDAVLYDQGRGSGAALARTLKVSPTYISDLRLGRSTPSLELALRIEQETGVPVAELVRKKNKAA